MKYIVLILSAAISLFIVSGCSSTIEDPEPPEEVEVDVIVGNWKLTKIIKDGIDLTDDCTTQSLMVIKKTNLFSGDDYDAVENDCLLTKFSGIWDHKISNEYTFSILGNEFIIELYGDTIRTDFIHAFDGKHYMEEHLRQQ